MTWAIIIVEPVRSRLHHLRATDRATLRQISQAIDILADEGPGLGRPLVDTVAGSTLSNLKELRPGSAGNTEVRLLFVFDSGSSSGISGGRRQGRQLEELVRPGHTRG